MFKTATGPKASEEEVPDIPVAESLIDPQKTPRWLDDFKPWLIATGILIVVAYGPQLLDQILGIRLNAPGFQPW
jgi:hypothetical protein